MIILEPVGGICNRLRAIDSMIALCQKYNKRLLVIWHKTPDLNASFEDLFSMEKKGVKISFSSSYKLARLAKLITRGRTTDYSHFHQTFEPEKHVHTGKSMLEAENAFYEKIEPFVQNVFEQKLPYYLSSAFRFSKPGHRSYNYFSPAVQLQASVANKTKDFHNTVGLHIRRTDSEFSIKVSSDDKVLVLMDKLIAKDDSIRFFIATDDLHFKEELKNRYPDRILYNEMTSVDRGDTKALQHAILDLYCLAATRKIYGSYQSSFSYVAADIGNVALEIIK